MKLQSTQTLVSFGPIVGLLMGLVGQAAAQTNSDWADPSVDQNLDQSVANVQDGLREAFAEVQHAAAKVPNGYVVRNLAQDWLTHFDGNGFLVQPNGAEWTWGFELIGCGFDGASTSLPSTNQVQALGGRVAYSWGESLEEWFVNDLRGLEHGYTIYARPEANGACADSPLIVSLAVRGDLHPEVNSEGTGIHFLSADGSSALEYSGLIAFDAEGTALPSRMTRTDTGIQIEVVEDGAVYPITIDPIAKQSYLKASNTDPGDLFGHSVAIDGDTAVVGAMHEASDSQQVGGNQGNQGDMPNIGAAYVFVKSGHTWTQQAYLKASNAHGCDIFGTSIDISGDTIVVGSPQEDSELAGINQDGDNSNLRASGAVFVFVRNGTTWTEEAYIKPTNPGFQDYFGIKVAIDGDTMVASSAYEDSGATGVNGIQADESSTDSGAVYVFERTGTTWAQHSYIKASDNTPGDQFGRALQMDANRIIVGAPQTNHYAIGPDGVQGSGSNLTGRAYIYNRIGGAWVEETILQASNADHGDMFGSAVAIQGDTALVGAQHEQSSATGVNGNGSDNSMIQSGAAYVFVRSAGVWGQQAYIKASNASDSALFGSAVELGPDMAVVGSLGEASNGTGVNGNQQDVSMAYAGAAYTFARTGSNWSQTNYLKASQIGVADGFGNALAYSQGTLLVGVPGEKSSSVGVDSVPVMDVRGAGATYVYDLTSPGEAYCGPANPNSTGIGASLMSMGSTAVASNELMLVANWLPPGQFGYFLNSTGQGFVANVNGSQGNLCVGGTSAIGRHNRAGEILFSGATGTFALAVDLTNLPTSQGAHVVLAGETYNFQAWFRDQNPGSTSNTTNGITVTFE